jgi:two-component system chemotaxis response regulator CheY
MNPKILNVDDSQTIRLSLSRLFARFACEWREAVNGAEGLTAALEETPDLILSDWNMPVMDGLKLISLIRRDVKYRNIPIMIITTEGGAEDRERALALGANAYITKPIQAGNVLEIAKSLLGIP